jgi:hypothetical protein
VVNLIGSAKRTFPLPKFHSWTCLFVEGLALDTFRLELVVASKCSCSVVEGTTSASAWVHVVAGEKILASKNAWTWSRVQTECELFLFGRSFVVVHVLVQLLSKEKAQTLQALLAPVLFEQRHSNTNNNVNVNETSRGSTAIAGVLAVVVAVVLTRLRPLMLGRCMVCRSLELGPYRTVHDDCALVASYRLVRLD